MSLMKIDMGFVPLTDAATLIVAQEMGFAAEEGLELVLHKEVIWSNIRDKVSLGIYPVAHMLSPLALAMSLGLGPMPVRITVPFVLNRNGNTLVAASQLAKSNTESFGDALALGQSLLAAFKGRSIRMGVPFPQSMHRELVRYWMAGCGSQNIDVEFSIAPPNMLGKVLAAGEIDAFMVGEPWGSLAVEQGDAEILLCGASIWSAAPEKVLAVRSDWAEGNKTSISKLIRALYRASIWVGDRENASSLAEILALPAYIDVAAEVIERALVGELVLDAKGRIGKNTNILKLSGSSVTFPWHSDALWIAEQAAQNWGLSRVEARGEAIKVFRPDLYRAALQPLGVNVPESEIRGEGTNADSFFDVREFALDA